MKNKSRDTNEIVIQKIIGYCNDVDVLMKRFNNSYEQYVSFGYRVSICLQYVHYSDWRIDNAPDR